MREAHAHIHSYGEWLASLKLDDVKSREECLGLIADHARRGPRDGWILGLGARVEGWKTPEWFSRKDLDAITGSRPACIMSFDHHAVFANSAAMAATGFRDDSPNPDGGVIVRDGGGAPTGLLLESAATMVWNAAGQCSPAEWRERVTAALKMLALHGFDEVHDLHAPMWLGPMLAEIDAAGELTQDVQLFVPLDQLDAAVAAARDWSRPRVRLAGAKLFADGTLNSATAWVLEPFAAPLDGMPNGRPLYTVAELSKAMKKVGGHGLTLAVHAIGDAAVRAVLDAHEESGRACRLRIEHCELIDKADVPRFKQLGVTASIQPCHLLADIEVLRRQFPGRLDRVLPLRELVDSGLTPGMNLIFGSDVPIVRPDPGDSIQAAVHRGRAGGRPIAPEQALTEAEAWACFHAT